MAFHLLITETFHHPASARRFNRGQIVTDEATIAMLSRDFPYHVMRRAAVSAPVTVTPVAHPSPTEAEHE